MAGTKRKAALLFLFLAALLATAVVGYRRLRPRDESLSAVLERGTLRFLTQNNAHTYYTYRGEPVGFEYDLAAAFAEHLGVELEVITLPWSQLFSALEEGRGDILGASVTVTPERRERFAFSEGYMVVRQEVIVHASNYAVRDLTDIMGMAVHVRRGTSYETRLRELMDGGLDIELILEDDVPTEELIRRVAEEEIPATVADSNIALLNRRYYPDAKITFSISAPQLIAWAMKPESEALVNEVNSFLRSIRETETYDRIYERYYDNVRVFDYFDTVVFHRRVATRLPKYLEAIKREADRFHFDWRLIAAVAYQESHYHPFARSHTGVEGFMQVTRRTAREMGIDNRLDAEQSIYAGVKYLSRLRERFSDIPNPRDRLLFSMAAYNVGYGHVRDAQEIAREKGLNPRRWSSLEEVLPLLRNPEYYRETVHGYARGTEPVRYVNRILTYYDILRRIAEAP